MPNSRRVGSGNSIRPVLLGRSWIAPVVVCVLGTALVVGCAQQRFALGRKTADEDSDEARLVEGSTLGRVQQIEALGQRASRGDAEQASEIARQLALELRPDQPTAIRSAIIRTLGRINSPAAVTGLRTGIQDPEPMLRSEACRSLARIDAPAAMDLLVETLARDTDTDVRLAAVRGLGEYRNPKALEALGGALDDRDPAVQYLAMQSMERVTGQKAGYDVRQWKEVARNPQSVLGEADRKWLR